MKLCCTDFWSGTLTNGETHSLFLGNEIELDDDVARVLLADAPERFEIIEDDQLVALAVDKKVDTTDEPAPVVPSPKRKRG